MTIYYIDASAWIKRYYEETGTQWIQNLFARSPTVTCATLGLIEVIATLVRKNRAQEINPEQLNQKTQELEQDWKQFIQIHFSPEIFTAAIQLTKDHGLRGADTIHLASALHLKRQLADEMDQLLLVASDRELLHTAQQCDLTVLNPEDEDRDSSSPAQTLSEPSKEKDEG